MGISFIRFNRRAEKNRRSPAIFDCKGIVHLGTLKIANCTGSGDNRHHNRGELCDFGALSWGCAQRVYKREVEFRMPCGKANTVKRNTPDNTPRPTDVHYENSLLQVFLHDSAWIL